MPSPIPNAGNSSSYQTTSSEQSLENELFTKVFKSYIPYYNDLDDLPNVLDYLISHIKNQCSLMSDMALSAVDGSNNGQNAVIEFRASDFWGAFDSLSNRLDVLVDVNDILTRRYEASLKENKQLKNQLLKTEQNFNEASNTAARYYQQVQDLSCELGVDADLGVDLNKEVPTDPVLDPVLSNNSNGINIFVPSNPSLKVSRCN